MLSAYPAGYGLLPMPLPALVLFLALGLLVLAGLKWGGKWR